MKLILSSLTLVAAVILATRFYLPIPHTDARVALTYERMLNVLASTPNSATILYDRVSIGYNTNSDLLVDATAVMEQLNLKPGVAKAHEKLTSLSDFAELVTYFMSDGSAVERVIVDTNACKTIVAAARQVKGMNEIVSRNLLI